MPCQYGDWVICCSTPSITAGFEQSTIITGSVLRFWNLQKSVISNAKKTIYLRLVSLHSRLDFLCPLVNAAFQAAHVREALAAKEHYSVHAAIAAVAVQNYWLVLGQHVYPQIQF